MVIGELMAVIGKENERKAMKAVSDSFWYKKIMVEGTPCSDYWQIEKD